MKSKSIQHIKPFSCIITEERFLYKKFHQRQEVWKTVQRRMPQFSQHDIHRLRNNEAFLISERNQYTTSYYCQKKNHKTCLLACKQKWLLANLFFSLCSDTPNFVKTGFPKILHLQGNTTTTYHSVSTKLFFGDFFLFLPN